VVEKKGVAVKKNFLCMRDHGDWWKIINLWGDPLGPEASVNWLDVKHHGGDTGSQGERGRARGGRVQNLFFGEVSKIERIGQTCEKVGGVVVVADSMVDLPTRSRGGRE